MPNLFPEDYETEVVTIDELNTDKPIGYKESVYFDEQLGDLLRDGHYNIRGATGVEAWEQWCINCLMTERDKYPCYGRAFGIKTEEAFKSNDRNKTESILTRELWIRGEGCLAEGRRRRSVRRNRSRRSG